MNFNYSNSIPDDGWRFLQTFGILERNWYAIINYIHQLKKSCLFHGVECNEGPRTISIREINSFVFIFIKTFNFQYVNTIVLYYKYINRTT